MRSTPLPRTEEDPDRDLVECWKRAHFAREEASREILERYSRKVAGYFRRQDYRPPEVDDLTQTTFAHVFHGLEDYRRETRFAVWLFQIAENVHRDQVRRRKTQSREGQRKERSLDEMMAVGKEPIVPVDALDAEEEILQAERNAALRREIEKLPPRTRCCLWLHVDHGLKVKEVGLAMNISPETVKALLYQARKHLKEKLGRYFADPGFPDEENHRGDETDPR